MVKLRMKGDISPLPHAPSWHALEEIYLIFIVMVMYIKEKLTKTDKDRYINSSTKVFFLACSQKFILSHSYVQR
jgi:hypothetical protein